MTKTITKKQNILCCKTTRLAKLGPSFCDFPEMQKVRLSPSLNINAAKLRRVCYIES
jgi:hypothetical protein